jgi:hypothetical protein
MKQYKTLYEELLLNWESECVSEALVPLSEAKLQNYLDFQKEIHQLEHLAPPSDANEEEINIIYEMKKESSKNVDYVINDLLAIRQEKIMQICKRLEVIELEMLTLSEQQFYRSISSAFKGYQKTKQYRNAIAESCVEDVALTDTEESCEEINDSVSLKKIEFCDARVLKEHPSLIGPNFVVYGPFHKEDIVWMPKKSAKIMEKEKIVEILE